MQENILPDTFKERVKWWNSSRYKLNKGLFFGGVIVILISGLIFEFFMAHSSDNPRMSLGYFLIASVVYILYFGLINLIFLVIEIIDRTYSISDSLTIRNTLLKIFFYLALTIPFLYPIFLLTMAFLH